MPVHDKNIAIWMDYAHYETNDWTPEKQEEVIKQFIAKFKNWLSKGVDKEFSCTCTFEGYDVGEDDRLFDDEYHGGGVAEFPSAIFIRVFGVEQDIDKFRQEIIKQLPQWEEEMRSEVDSEFRFSEYMANLRNFNPRADRFEQAVTVE